jgi:phosphotriesterase-related protein
MAAIQSVLGEIDTGDLGFTLSHEHIIVSNGEDWQHYPWLYDRQRTLDSGIEKMRALKAGGVDTIIDLTTPDLGRDIQFMIEASAASGVQVVAATGIWLDPPRSIMERDEDATADIFVHELEEGIGSTSVRAGVIKVANDTAGIALIGRKVIQSSTRK